MKLQTADGKLTLERPDGKASWVNGWLVKDDVFDAVRAALGDKLAPVPPPDPDAEAAERVVNELVEAFIRGDADAIPRAKDAVRVALRATRESGRAEGRAAGRHAGIAECVAALDRAAEESPWAVTSGYLRDVGKSLRTL